MSANVNKTWLREALEKAESDGQYEFSLRLPLPLMQEFIKYEEEIDIFAGPTEFCRAVIRDYLDTMKKEQWRHHKVSLSDVKE